MNDAEFRHLLESCTTLNDEQRTILHNMVSRALDHMWWEDIETCLTGHICAAMLVCADALAQHHC